jgi:hypothetical protein
MKSSTEILSSKEISNISLFSETLENSKNTKEGKIKSRLGFAYFTAVLTCLILLFL